MTDIKLGFLPKADQKRDAIHVAILTCVSDKDVHAGQAVSVLKTDEIPPKVTPAGCGGGIGIVDPFIPHALGILVVPAGEPFQVLIYQETVTGMRHAWQHPQVPDEVQTVEKVVEKEVYKPLADITPEQSYQWIVDYAGREGLWGVEELIAGAIGESSDSYGSYSVDGDYFLCYGYDAYGAIPSELWDHIENYTGKKCVGRPTRFSCSC